MKSTAIVFILLLLSLSGCIKKEIKVSSQSSTIVIPPTYQGGKGGEYSIAIFPVLNTKSVKARIYFKYAAATAPKDTTLYDEIENTMIEPGYGNHAHFNTLLPGTYYCMIISGSYKGDSVIVINNKSKYAQNINVQIH